MPNQSIKRVISKAISLYITHYKDNKAEINNALINRELPAGLIDLIDDESEKRITKLLAKAHKDCFAAQQQFKNNFLKHSSVENIKEDIKHKMAARAELVNNLHAEQKTELDYRNFYQLEDKPKVDLYLESATFQEISSVSLSGPVGERDYLLNEAGTFNKEYVDELRDLIYTMYTMDREGKIWHSSLAHASMERVLIKMHWARLVRASTLLIDELKTKINDLISQISELKAILDINEFADEYSPQNSKLVYHFVNQYRLEEDKLALPYDFNELDKEDLDDILDKLFNALKPLIKDDPELTYAVEQYEMLPKKLNDLEHRKSQVLELINEALVELSEPTHRNKKSRMEQLRTRIDNISISETSTLEEFRDAINDWRSFKTNEKDLHTSWTCRVFHGLKFKSHEFFQKCLACFQEDMQCTPVATI